jgi:hypothetical protein
LPQKIGDGWITFVLENDAPFRYYRLVCVEQGFNSIAEIKLWRKARTKVEVGEKPPIGFKTILYGDMTFETNRTELGDIDYPDESIDSANLTVAEVSVKVSSAPKEEYQHDGAIFAIQNGKTEGKLAFYTDHIEFLDMNSPLGLYSVDTTSNFHIYRLILSHSTLTAYADDEKVFSAELTSKTRPLKKSDKTVIARGVAPKQSHKCLQQKRRDCFASLAMTLKCYFLHFCRGLKTSKKRILFGDFSNRPEANFNVQVKYLAYTTNGTLAPND